MSESGQTRKNAKLPRHGSRVAFASAASTNEESLYFWGENFWRGIVGLTF
jgi:hypothetical protein